MQALASANPLYRLLCFAQCSREFDEPLDMPVSVSARVLSPGDGNCHLTFPVWILWYRVA